MKQIKQPECNVSTFVDSGPHYGRLYCNMPEGHKSNWHQMCHPGTNYPVFFLITDCSLHIAESI